MEISKLMMLIFFLLFSCENKNQEELNTDDDKRIIEITPKNFIDQLPVKLSENSGLIFYKDLFWSFNDSGGENVLFGFNGSGKIAIQIQLKNSENNDWEDIAQDKEFIYIGDFGNNNGARKNLNVLKISKSEITSESNQAIESEIIRFSFSDQQKFGFPPYSTPFDCEAITDIDGELNLFSKRWNDETTTVYRLPKTAGDYSLSPVDSFQVEGLITGADFNPESSILALSGYQDFKPILWLFYDVSKENIFGRKSFLIKMDSIAGAQTEGICFWGKDTLLISCESTFNYPAQVFFIDLKKLE